MSGLQPSRTPSASTLKTTRANQSAPVVRSHAYPPALPPAFLSTQIPKPDRQRLGGGPPPGPAIFSASSNFLLPAPTCSSLQSAVIYGALPTANLHTRRRMPRSAGPPAGSRQQSLSCHFTASVRHCQIRLGIRSAPSDALMKSVTVTVRIDPTPVVA